MRVECRVSLVAEPRGRVLGEKSPEKKEKEREKEEREKAESHACANHFDEKKNPQKKPRDSQPQAFMLRHQALSGCSEQREHLND